MQPPRLNRHRATTWVTVLALWLGSLAPLVSHALARSGDIAWQDICTTSPPNAAAARRAGQPVRMPDAGHAFGHCPCCGASAMALALPPAALAVVPAPLVMRALSPQRFLGPVRAWHAWSTAQARAPPRYA